MTSARARQRELELARARDRDNANTRKRKALLAIIAYMLLQRGRETSRERQTALDRMIRRLEYHSTRKGLLTNEVTPPRNSNWTHFIGVDSNRDEAWFEWVTLPRQSFLDLVAICEPTWRTTPIEASNGDHVHGTPRPQDLAVCKPPTAQGINSQIAHLWGKNDQYQRVGR